MTQPTSSPPLVSDLQKGDKLRDVVFLVETSNFKQTRNQKYFIQMILRDRTGSLRGVRWEATEELYRSFGVDDFVRVDGRVEEFQGSLQLVVDRIEPEPAENEPDDLPRNA
ncbi:MAG: OB-fold nucleic acid binding domain-containing protein, partial [Planctomycetota bacterium]